MKKIILLLFLTFIECFAYQSKIYSVRAYSIYDNKTHSENILHSFKTKHDYNGECYVKVLLIGKLFQHRIFVNIGNSIGSYQSSKPVVNKFKNIVGELQLFKFSTVKKGKIEIRVNRKVYEKRVYVK